MATAVKEMTVDDLREMIQQTVRQTIEDYLADLRLLLPLSLGRQVEELDPDNDPRPLADRPLKPSLDH
ncbi:MAG TPA: hypothetical protein VNM67_02620 [Thermoanaerobaculia bacterium]|jgi:hypothetical protein|nr:hypothetical protein [Thermoanaerobaculia bacterium]